MKQNPLASLVGATKLRGIIVYSCFQCTLYPMYPILNLKTPNLGLKISKLGFGTPGIVVTWAWEVTI